MTLRNTLKLSYLVPFALSLACGAADEAASVDSNASGERTAEVDQPLGVVATAETGYSTVYFHEQDNDDGSVSIGVSELAPANYASTPLKALFAEGHTDLEVFMALLPDSEAPTSFVDAHRIQAAALGRDTEEIRTAVFDADAPIEKSVTWCRGIANPTKVGDYEYTYSGAISADDKYGTAVQTLTLNAGISATAPAICNEPSSAKTSSHTVSGRVLMKKNGGSYDNPGWTPAVAPGWAWQWHGLQLMQYNCGSLPPGSICLPSAVDASYQMQGKSATTSATNTYDMYISKIASKKYVGPVVVVK